MSCFFCIIWRVWIWTNLKTKLLIALWLVSPCIHKCYKIFLKAKSFRKRFCVKVLFKRNQLLSIIHSLALHTLFPTAMVFPFGLQQMLIFSPLVLTTWTHLLAEARNNRLLAACTMNITTKDFKKQGWSF